MPGESLTFDITANDRASRQFRDVGRAAADASVKMDVAAASLAVFDKASLNAGKAAKTSETALRSHVAADKLYADAMRVASGETTKFTKLIHAMPGDLDKAASSAATLGKETSAAAGTGGITGGGMGALVATGVVLSPVLASLTVGAAGFAAAAYGVAKPIENAAQKTGGLTKNLHTLDAEQQTVARGILSLGKQYDAFQAALKPTVLHDFNAGLQLAGHLLRDVQPVAVSFGKAFGGFLHQVDQMFGSGEWQAFFNFMARTAGPDLKLVGSLFVHLASDLPPLLVALQPVATTLLKTADALALTGRAAEQLSGGPLTAMENFGKAGQSVKDSATGVSGFNAALDVLIGPQQTHSVDNFFHSLHEGFNILTGAEKGALKPTHDLVPAWEKYKTVAYSATFQTGRLGRETDTVSGKAKIFAGITAQDVVNALKKQAHELNVTAAGYENALGPLGNYISAQITEANDLKILNDDLKKSHDAIGLKTQAERNSFGAAQTYITDTLKQGNAALAAHQGIEAQIKSIEHALPQLESVRGKTAAYRQELGDLKGILDKLRAEKLIQEQVRVSGTGTWQLSRIGAGPLSSKPLAAGGVVTGGVAGRDSVPIMAMPGEVVVPAGMVKSGAVDHLRGALPGFAAGGIVGGYSGPVAGLPPWTSHNQAATVTAIGTSIARAMASAFKASLSSGFGTAGPGGGAPAANAALARRMMPAWGSGAEWAAWNYVAMRESGWNQFARNPSSGAYGIPQALPASKMGPAANPPQSNPAAQISWMIGYIRGRYGDPIGAAAHERAFNWYGNGLRNGVFRSPTLIGVGERGPEMVNVTPAGGGSAQTVVLEVCSGGAPADALLAEILRKYVRVRGGNVQQVLGRN